MIVYQVTALYNMREDASKTGYEEADPLVMGTTWPIVAASPEEAAQHAARIHFPLAPLNHGRQLTVGDAVAVAWHQNGKRESVWLVCEADGWKPNRQAPEKCRICSPTLTPPDAPADHPVRTEWDAARLTAQALAGQAVVDVVAAPAGMRNCCSEYIADLADGRQISTVFDCGCGSDDGRPCVRSTFVETI